jgi:ribonuclease BN (tRNA processing enzyme)
MIVRVLGCSGGEARGRRATSILLGDRLLIDAGSAASTLDPAEQARLEWVLLTHAHLDHVKELPFLCDNRMVAGSPPLRLLATPDTLAAVRAHLLNGRLYPDWTRVPEAAPALVVEAIEPGRRFHLGGLAIEALPLRHPGGCVAWAIEGADGALVWAGDTGPAPELREAVRARGARVKALALEVSLPDRLTEMALLTGHLTPGLLRAEIEPLGDSRPEIWVHHLKPTLRDETLREIERLALPRVRVLEDGDRIELDLGPDVPDRTSP